MISPGAIRLGEMSPEEFGDLYRQASPEQRPKLLRARLRFDLEAFCRYCWPGKRFSLPFNELHRELFRLGQVEPWDTRTQTLRTAVAAPRGYSKSTIVSFARVVHDIVYGNEAYIVILSEGQRLSTGLSTDIREQFLDPETLLAKLYGPFKVTGGVEQWEVSVRGRPTVGILPRSFGSSVRGAKHPRRGIRPTKVIIDDGEDKDHVRNPDQRKVWWDSLTKDVLKLGDRAGGTVYEVVGTILHPDSMLARLMVDAGWRAQRWKALNRWPERADLWEKCRTIWSDLTLGRHRQLASRAFFVANRAEMERGAELLDPASRDLFALYEIIWSEGLASFLQELQNDPIDPTTQIFFSEKFKRFRVVGDEVIVLDETKRRIKLRDLRKHGHWDPAIGTPHGDYGAISTVGRDSFGYAFVLEAWMQRAKPSTQLAAAWSQAERWQLKRMTVEGNGFQELVAEPYKREREERREAERFWMLQIEPEAATDNKELRIATLEPDVTNGWIMFNENIPQEVLAQFDAFPTGDHDDGPDAIHGAWRGTGGRSAHME